MRASARLETSRVVPILWGLSATLLLLFVAAFLFNTHVLALLGIIVLAATLALASLGFAVAALSLGTHLTDVLGLLETDTLAALRLGLWAMGLTAGIPFLGWLLVVLLLASGIGTVLETLVSREATLD
jgi:cobalamin biosynthesis protein CobD/CbiB